MFIVALPIHTYLAEMKKRVTLVNSMLTRSFTTESPYETFFGSFETFFSSFPMKLLFIKGPNWRPTTYSSCVMIGKVAELGSGGAIARS